MTFVISVIAALAVIAAAVFAVRTWMRYRGKMLVGCPENSQPAAVEVKAARAAITGLAGKPWLELSSCSRWPERHDCGQQCLRQIERAPEECMVKTMAARWYAGKTCVVCGRAFDPIDWMERAPGLIRPDDVTMLWSDVDVVRLDEVLATHRPVCWNCHIAATFRRSHPELVLDNPWAAATPTAKR